MAKVRKLSSNVRGGLTTAVRAALTKAQLQHEGGIPPDQRKPRQKPSMPRLKCLERPALEPLRPLRRDEVDRPETARRARQDARPGTGR